MDAASSPVDRPQPPDYPVAVGSMLFTLVDPHRGREVDYNRWYERDHFYAGCMIGAWNIKGKSGHQELFEIFAGDPDALRRHKQDSRQELESIIHSMPASRHDVGLRRALRERMEAIISSAPEGYSDGPATYLLKQLTENP